MSETHQKINQTFWSTTDFQSSEITEILSFIRTANPGTPSGCVFRPDVSIIEISVQFVMDFVLKNTIFLVSERFQELKRGVWTLIDAFSHFPPFKMILNRLSNFEKFDFRNVWFRPCGALTYPGTGLGGETFTSDLCSTRSGWRFQTRRALLNTNFMFLSVFEVICGVSGYFGGPIPSSGELEPSNHHPDSRVMIWALQLLQEVLGPPNQPKTLQITQKTLKNRWKRLFRRARRVWNRYCPDSVVRHGLVPCPSHLVAFLWRGAWVLPPLRAWLIQRML